MAYDKTEYDKVEQVDQDLEKKEDEVVETQEAVRLKPVAKAKPAKRNLLDRLVTGLIGPNGIPGVARHVKDDVIIPSLRDLAGDAIRSAGDTIAGRYFGEGRSRQTGYRGGYASGPSYNKTNYNQPAKKYGNGVYQPPAKNYGASYTSDTIELERGMTVDNFIIDTRADAQNVLDGLRDHILTFGMVTVADYYDLIGVEPKYTDNNFGWDDLQSVRVQPTRGGFILLLPPVEMV